MVEAIFAFLRRELLHHGQAPGERDVCRDLTPEGTMTDRLEPGLQRLENLILREIGELVSKALEVAERVLVDEADQTE